MRGKKGQDGDTHVSANGYHYTRKGGEWYATHVLILEEKLGRKLNKDTEGARFVDGDRTNLKPENITLRIKGKGSLEKRAAQLETRIEELQGQLAEVRKQILAQGADSTISDINLNREVQTSRGFA